jgi:hypothetical protein
MLKINRLFELSETSLPQLWNFSTHGTGWRENIADTTYASR